MKGQSAVNVENQLITDKYALYNGDSCEIMKGIPDNSIHFSIFSPPFASLYTYSNSDRDLGNCRTTTEFYDWVTINGVSVPKYKTIVTCHG